MVVPVCPPGSDTCGDPHLQGVRGQRMDWAGVDGGWYSLVKDDADDLHVNVRVTAPLPRAFPERQLITAVAVLAEGRSLVIEVGDPYTVGTEGCPAGIASPCLANGGLRALVDGSEVDEVLVSSRRLRVADGAFEISATNLPVECRQFGGDRIWARMYKEMLQGKRRLSADESFEDWVLSFDHMAAPDWCAKYIDEKGLGEVQSDHAIFKISTPTAIVRLNISLGVGLNHQDGGQITWDGRILPDLDFWQMDVGLHGLKVDSPFLSGILGETARPVLSEAGQPLMEGMEAFRGKVEDYRVADPLATHFALLDEPKA